MKKTYTSARLYVLIFIVFSILYSSCDPGDSETQRKKRGIKDKEYYTNPKENKKRYGESTTSVHAPELLGIKAIV